MGKFLPGSQCFIEQCELLDSTIRDWLGPHIRRQDVKAWGLKGMNVASVCSENKGTMCVLFQTPEAQTPIGLRESTSEEGAGLTPRSLGQGHVSKRQSSYPERPKAQRDQGLQTGLLVPSSKTTLPPLGSIFQ